MKADMEAMKEKMATMMEAMMSIKEIMEVSAAYQTRARARVMGEVEEVQEQMKVNMEAMKEQMTTMMSMRRMMEVNVAIVVATGTATEVDPTHPSGLNQVNHPASDMVGQGGKALGSTGDPHFVHVQNKHSFPPYTT